MLGTACSVGFDKHSMVSLLLKLVLHVSLWRWEQCLGLLRSTALKGRPEVFISLLPPVTKLKKEPVALERIAVFGACSEKWHITYQRSRRSCPGGMQTRVKCQGRLWTNGPFIDLIKSSSALHPFLIFWYFLSWLCMRNDLSAWLWTGSRSRKRTSARWSSHSNEVFCGLIAVNGD